MVKGFFITGTDTGVGKTVISASLICFLNNLGYRTGAMKPIESGCKIQRFKGLKKIHENNLIPNDGMFLKKIANMEDSIDLITPVRFKEPLAPFTASKIEGNTVNIKKIKDAFSRLSKKYELLIVEGIGGLLVPVKENYYVLDLAEDTGLPLIVVARPSLGTLNHTMLTVNYAIKEGLRVAGIIINYNQPPENTIAEKTNTDILKQISPIPVIGTFPYLNNIKYETLKKTVLKSLNTDTIKNLLYQQHNSK